ncbi:HupE/UreJ family protein [Rhizobium giardinii]|jgi:hydrogenase/urease accessory protein HupE|uniref:HupE/UreJ family protein n=1 Tax=Rhizobium giardinii TaxID=56731 RepID=UPI000DD82499
MIRLFLHAALLLVSVLTATATWAHEARPAYLQVTQLGPERFDIQWRTPVLQGMRLPVVLKFPDAVRNVTEPTQRELADSLIERRIVETIDGLAGQRIEFIGLQTTITDVLVRTETSNGVTTTLVRPTTPYVVIAAEESWLSVTRVYVVHGIEHILGGYDHLLFVLALVLIVKNRRRLVATITAFTAAHSITLALATLGFVNVPGPPVEAMIAMSILLLATEIVRAQRGAESLTARWPWMVAFAFGLLHGLGFAGALTAIGLPQGDVPLALLMFNVGVEIGQLMFVAVILMIFAMAGRIPSFGAASERMRLAASYGIGGLAAFWMIERIAQFGT